MQFDPHKNLSISKLAAVPVDALNGTDFAVMPGDGFMFEVGMPVTLMPSDRDLSLDSAEIGYITSKDGDELTIERAQEGSFAREVKSGWIIAATLTAKSLEDIEDALTALDAVVRTKVSNELAIALAIAL